MLNAVLYVVLLGLCLPLGMVARPRHVAGVPDRLTRGEAAAAFAIWLVVAIPSLAQLVAPAILPALSRDPQRIIAGGEPWRVITSVVVQDGGLAGTAFNLGMLAVVAPLGVRAWGAARAVLILVLVQLVFGMAATAVVAAPGAGNSAATFGLASSMAGLAAVRHRDAGVLWRVAGVGLVGIASLVIGDAHGIAMLAGLLLGAAVAVAWPR